MTVLREGKRATATALAVPDPLLGYELPPAFRRADPDPVTPLDECARFLGRYNAATPAQIDAMTLAAAVSWACKVGVLSTIPRVLFTSENEESGKTNAMKTMASLCYRPVSLKGTRYAMRSKLARAGTEGVPCPTLYFDEISKIFGKSGTRGDNHPVAHILTEGYKSGATDSRSVGQTDDEFSIFSLFLMTGLKTAVPRDIRTRCIVINMVPAEPQDYFDARDAEPKARILAGSLSAWIGKHEGEIRDFRGRRLGIPKLIKRRLEVWEPLFAVASCAGQDWLRRCYAAFCELALSESDRAVLTPDQTLYRDLARIVRDSGALFAGGYDLADELARLDGPLYAGQTRHQLACLIRDTVPLTSRQVRTEGRVVRGYFATDLIALWESVRPEDEDDMIVVADEPGPFDVTDDGEAVTDLWTVTSDVTDVTGARVFVTDTAGETVPA